MRCKNCGSENDDNLYICQNCGSPLYDEDDLQEQNTDQNTGDILPPETVQKNQHQKPQSDEDDKKRKQQTIIIIVLVIVLLAIIIGTVIAVAGSKKDDETTSSSTTTAAVQEQTSKNDYINNYTTDNTTSSTTQPSTTTTTTTTTTSTTTTTTTTTAAEMFQVTLSCNEGGEVEGDGQYKRGDHITVFARPSDGYEFDGWYAGSAKVSGNTKYSFTVTGDTNLEAVFVLPDESTGE